MKTLLVVGGGLRCRALGDCGGGFEDLRPCLREGKKHLKPDQDGVVGGPVALGYQLVAVRLLVDLNGLLERSCCGLDAPGQEGEDCTVLRVGVVHCTVLRVGVM